MNTEANNVFEAQGKFLDAIQQMIDDEEVTLDGDDLIGYESLVEQYNIMSGTIGPEHTISDW